MTRTPHSHHSPEFKEQALLKARHRGAQSILSLATELNMSPGTLKRWVLDSTKTGEQAPGETATSLALVSVSLKSVTFAP
jgi:transposase